MEEITVAICPHMALNNNRGSVATYAILVLRKPYNLYRISPSMNRLNRIVDSLNEVIAYLMYAQHCVAKEEEDEEKRREEIKVIMEKIGEAVEERSVWEGIREYVRKGVR